MPTDFNPQSSMEHSKKIDDILEQNVASIIQRNNRRKYMPLVATMPVIVMGIVGCFLRTIWTPAVLLSVATSVVFLAVVRNLTNSCWDWAAENLIYAMHLKFGKDMNAKECLTQCQAHLYDLKGADFSWDIRGHTSYGMVMKSVARRIKKSSLAHTESALRAKKIDGRER